MNITLSAILCLLLCYNGFMKAVYAITNTKTNQTYIGSTIDFNRRVKAHLRLLRYGDHHSPHLQNSFNKYGEEFFVFGPIEVVAISEKLILREQHWIDTLSPEFNVLRVAGSHLGAKRSKATRERMSKSATGKKCSEETKEKLRKINLGKKQSEETKQKRSKSLKKYYQLAGVHIKQLECLRESVNARKKAVIKLHKVTEEEIEQFESFEDAARNVGLTSGECVSRVVNGKAQTAAGFKWRLV